MCWEQRMRAKKMLCSSPEGREHPGVVDVCGQKGPQKSAGPQKFVVFTQCLQSQETECSVLGMLLSYMPRAPGDTRSTPNGTGAPRITGIQLFSHCPESLISAILQEKLLIKHFSVYFSL